MHDTFLGCWVDEIHSKELVPKKKGISNLGESYFSERDAPKIIPPNLFDRKLQ